MEIKNLETNAQNIYEEGVLTRDLLSIVPENARPYLTALLTRAISNLNTEKDLEKHFRILRDISTRILKRQSSPTASDIRQLRKSLRIPQRVFGQLTGVSRTSVSHWENKKNSPHPLQQEYIHAIADQSEEGLSMVIAYLKEKRQNIQTREQ